MAATIDDLDARRPHLRGPARCLACQHHWEAIAPEGQIVSLECPQCDLFQGVFEGIVSPPTRFVCHCGCDIYFILPDCCQCVRCGVVARGF